MRADGSPSVGASGPDESSVGHRKKTTRLLLVHDPQGLHFVNPDERILAFAGMPVRSQGLPESGTAHLFRAGRGSGHNHGGQIGLVTFGLRWTLPRAVLPVSPPQMTAGLEKLIDYDSHLPDLYRPWALGKGQELLVCASVRSASLIPLLPDLSMLQTILGARASMLSPSGGVCSAREACSRSQLAIEGSKVISPKNREAWCESEIQKSRLIDSSLD